MADLVTSVESGNRRAALEALRDAIANTIVGAEPSNVAALAKQLRDTMTELAELRDGVEVDRVDELAARRPAAASVPKRTKGAR